MWADLYQYMGLVLRNTWGAVGAVLTAVELLERVCKWKLPAIPKGWILALGLSLLFYAQFAIWREAKNEAAEENAVAWREDLRYDVSGGAVTGGTESQMGIMYKLDISISTPHPHSRPTRIKIEFNQPIQEDVIVTIGNFGGPDKLTVYEEVLEFEFDTAMNPGLPLYVEATSVVRQKSLMVVSLMRWGKK